ncbi:MAG: hypothetical protein ACR2LR_21010, partial [Hassallia sp.]
MKRRLQPGYERLTQRSHCVAGVPPVVASGVRKDAKGSIPQWDYFHFLIGATVAVFSTILHPTIATAQTETPPSASSVFSAVQILSPTPDTIADDPATTVILQFPALTQVELQVNGQLVDKSLIGRTETDSKTNLTTQIWYGVSLKEGENIISAQVAGRTPVITRVILRGAPKRLTVETVEARIPADARSLAKVRGQLV